LPKYGDDQIYKSYFHLQNGQEAVSEFSRHVYTIPNTLCPVLIHYIGDESLYVPSAHGNSNVGQVFVTTKKSTLTQLTQQLTSSNPHIVYKNQQEICRNVKQTQNLKYKVNKNNRLEYDQL
jgi:hypothetical protein